MIKISQPHIPAPSFDAIHRVLHSGYLVQGPYGQEVEQTLSRLLHHQHAILTSSGTAALHLALLALNIGDQDAVLVPNMTFPATINVVHTVGARAVLVDVHPHSYVMTIETIQQAIDHYKGSQALKAIMVVHEFGYPADMPAIMEIARRNHLLVIEDAACALSAHIQDKQVGTWGDIGCFSFHPRKIVTCGEGGLLTCQDDALAQRVLRLKNHGIQRDDQGVHFVEAGLNYRLSDLHASLLLPQLQRLAGWVEKRRQLAQMYLNALAPLQQQGLLSLPATAEGHVWQSFVICLASSFQASDVIKKLRQLEIESNCGAQILSTLPSVIQQVDFELQHLSSHHVLHEKTIALPFCEQYDQQIIDRVVCALQDVLSHK